MTTAMILLLMPREDQATSPSLPYLADEVQHGHLEDVPPHGHIVHLGQQVLDRKGLGVRAQHLERVALGRQIPLTLQHLPSTLDLATAQRSMKGASMVNGDRKQLEGGGSSWGSRRVRVEVLSMHAQCIKVIKELARRLQADVRDRLHGRC